MKSKIFISRLLLAIFVMVQVSVLHELEHDDSSHNCDICMVAHDLQSTSFEVPTAVVAVSHIQIPVVKQENYKYYAFAKASSKTSHLSIRPPPAV